MPEEERAKIKETLNFVYDAMEEKGYNALDQMVGYMLSGEPSYISVNRNARGVLTSIDRDDIMTELVRYYLNK